MAASGDGTGRREKKILSESGSPKEPVLQGLVSDRYS